VPIFTWLKCVVGKQQQQSCRLDWAKSSWTRWIQILLFTWIAPILSLGNKRTLLPDDLDDLSTEDKCSVLLNRIDQYSSKWKGTWHVLMRTFYKDFIMSMVLIFPLVIARIAQPMLIRQIVDFVGGETGSPAYVGYLYAIAICISANIQAIINSQIFFRNTRIGMRVRNALSSVIYKHLLTINTAALHNTTAAQMINLVANDAGKFEELSINSHGFMYALVETCATFGLVWWYIGLPTLFGYAVLILIVPLQLIFSKQFSRYRKTTMSYTDKRVQTINELVNGCQIIKMYNWEKAMEERVREARQRELSSIYKASCLRAVNIALSYATLPLTTLATFGGSWLMDRTLLPEDIFATLAVFALVRVPVTVIMLNAIEKFSEALVSAKRIDQFMQLDILLNKREKLKNESGEYAILMEDASFSWNDVPSLFSLNLKIRNGSLIGVKGATGSGKSTLLAAILSEINLVSGKLRVYADSISYAPQSAWIFADTIQANILLGKPMDEERYKNVIKACCLDIDLRNFGEVGDSLMIGDKGVNLSGGQKARMSLARALYADADLYLLDDPLAAVDPKVAKKIFDQCIGPRSFLRGKTRILVTHQTHFLVESDQVILLTNGHIDELGVEKRSEIEPSNDMSETDSSKNEGTDWIPNAASNDMNSIVKDEASSDGAIKWNVWLQLFTAPPLYLFGFFLMIILMLGNQALYDFTNSWLSIWSRKDEKEQQSSYYASIYLGAILATFIGAIIRIGYIYYIILRGATYFHNRMLKGMLYTSLHFFESNPSGRILNRASKDQQVLDEALPFSLIDATQYLLMSVGCIAVIGMTNPWVLLVLIPLVPTVLWLRRYYIRSSRQLKRLESVTRSPIFALFSSSLDGLTSIRAFGVQSDFLNMFVERIDANSQAYFLLSATARWFGVRLDIITSIFTLVTAILLVALRHQIDPSAAALGISYCITLSGQFQWAVRQSADTENFMTSAERIHEYGQLMPESHQNSNENDLFIQSAHDWPSRGTIEFKNYTFRYRSELGPVLKNLNLRIESKEKIGVIGRTGMITSFLKKILLKKNTFEQQIYFIYYN
jgi:ATP-binding cassette subfamily C (CFTR/MRP) protein 4